MQARKNTRQNKRVLNCGCILMKCFRSEDFTCLKKRLSVVIMFHDFMFFMLISCLFSCRSIFIRDFLCIEKAQKRSIKIIFLMIHFINLQFNKNNNSLNLTQDDRILVFLERWSVSKSDSITGLMGLSGN